MEKVADIIRRFDWSDLSSSDSWRVWRDTKIRTAESLLSEDPVEFDRLDAPPATAVSELERRCSICNYAVYKVTSPDPTVAEASAALLAFAARFGLFVTEDHRSAAEDGVVALRTTSEEGKKGFIPYTPKPMNWHTDGYYNAPDRPIRGFILHCHRQAASGGENQILDPEIAYLRLRDENPDYVRALMHPEAMTIPESVEADGSIRPVSVGPVFFSDPSSGRLQMRYTSRTRSISWRDDPTTLAAVGRLSEILSGGDPLMQQVRLESGHGILNNNVLHNRTGFADGGGERDTRVILRVRFHARVAEAFDDAA